MEIGQAHGFAMQAVQVRRLDQGMPVGGYIAIASVIGDDENDIGSSIGGRGGQDPREPQKDR